MRNDQLPEQTAESERTPNRRIPGFMDFTPLAVLQQRLNELERNYGNLQNFHDDSILASRIARVAPMSAGPDNARRRLPSISYQASTAFDISAFHLQNPTAVTFSNAAAAVAAASDDAAMRSTVRVASNSASYSTASANTATYSSSPIRNSSAPPSLYRIASTTAFYGAGSSTNSDTESDISTETASISEHDYDVIPPFRRRALALDINDAAVANAAARRRALDEDEDEDMDEDPVPRKHAKRSMHHVTVVNRFGGNGSGSGGNGSGSGGNGSGFGGNGSGFGGNGSGSGGNGSGVGGNGSGVGGNGGDDMMDCEL